MAHEAAEVEKTLAVIRRLMERGQEYEAVSGRGALLAGGAALAASAWLEWGGAGGSATTFLWTWVAVALLAVSWTTVSALRGASRDGKPVSAQARAVGRAVLPAYVAAATLTVAAWRIHDAVGPLVAGRLDPVDRLPGAWMLLHGVAILATGHHAPTRLVRLGVAFLCAGVVATLIPLDRDLAMALGFGGLHLAYGLVAVARPQRDAD